MGTRRLCSALPPPAVTKLAAELTRRLFAASAEGARPSSIELGACARAVGALAPKERERHARTLGHLRGVLVSACLAPAMAEIFASLLRAKIGEAVALAEARASVVAHRGLSAARVRTLRAEGHTELADEHEQTIAVLDQQLALLDERRAASTAELEALATTDPLAGVLAETREVAAALGFDIAPGALTVAAEAVRKGQEQVRREIAPALSELDELAIRARTGGPVGVDLPGHPATGGETQRPT